MYIVSYIAMKHSLSILAMFEYKVSFLLLCREKQLALPQHIAVLIVPSHHVTSIMSVFWFLCRKSVDWVQAATF